MLEIIQNLGFMSFVTLIVFLIAVRTGWDIKSIIGQIGFGIVFAAMALLVVKMPVRLNEGATFDFRAAPAVLSAFFGGPVAGLITAATASWARYQLGGPVALGGAVSPFLYCLAGLIGSHILRIIGRSKFGPLGYLMLALLASATALPSFFIGVEPSLSITILKKIWPMFLLGNCLGILVLGLMIEETLRIRDERAAFMEASIAAKAGLEAKNRFLSAVSHDIRTPLNGIRGALQLLDGQLPPQGDRRMIRIAEQSARYLEDLVEQILDFAKLQSGALPNRTKIFTVEQLLDGVTSMFASSAQDKGLSLKAILNDNMDQVLEDRYDSLRQVLFNLVGNAVRYTSTGSVTVSAKLSAVGAGQSRLLVEVTDTGPGIADADRDRVFEQFVRLVSSPNGDKGSGLGLSIARSLVEQMGGSLRLRSKVGQGSTFSFSVILKQASAIDTLVSDVPHPAAAEKVMLSGRTILVVDDNLLNRDLLSEALRKMGSDVLAADCGQAAIEILKKNASCIDAVLMDIQMPDITGDEVTRIVRAEVPAAASIPIVAVTANAFTEQRQAYMQAGMNAVVIKPVDFATLAITLTELLGRREQTVLDTGQSTVPEHQQIPALNRQHLKSLMGFVPEDRVWALLEQTLDEVEQRLSDLAQLKENKVLRTAEIAHDIKGLSANMGLDQVSKAAAELEEGCSEDRAPPLIDALSLAASVARAELALVKSGQATE